jgi:hypothetical protein
VCQHGFAHRVAVIAEDGVLVEHVIPILWNHRRLETTSSQPFVVSHGYLVALTIVLVDMFEFDAQDNGLQLVETAVNADDIVMILLAAAVSDYAAF